ncbi:MAG: hypothetical protein ABSF75_03455 [Terracidiphilus sp.]|jgi:hypothetical protein
MINIDLSKGLYLRPLLYLLALFPGLFFLLSVALADPGHAKLIIGDLTGIVSLPLYALSLILAGAGLIIGEAFILVAWTLEMALAVLYKAPRAIFRKLLGAQRVCRWFASIQGVPPKQNTSQRLLSRWIMAARTDGDDQSPDAKAAWWCVIAAAETLLNKRYGIDEHRASGPNGGEWQVWASVLGRPITPMMESLNAARTILATGLAGFTAILISPELAQRYYVSMCSLFVFAGAWTAIGYLRFSRNVIRTHVLRLRSIMLELREATQVTRPDSK